MGAREVHGGHSSVGVKGRQLWLQGPGAAVVLAVQRAAVVHTGRCWRCCGWLLVWQLWVLQEDSGSGVVQGNCLTSSVPTGVAGSCAWQGQGLVLRCGGGLKLGLQPIAVSSLTVKGAEGLQAGGVRWLLGAGCWLMAASRAGGPRVLRGAGTDGGGEGEWGGLRAPHLPTAPGATGGLEEAPLSVGMAQGAGQHGAAAVGAPRGPALPGRVKEVKWDVAPSPGC